MREERILYGVKMDVEKWNNCDDYFNGEDPDFFEEGEDFIRTSFNIDSLEEMVSAYNAKSYFFKGNGVTQYTYRIEIADREGWY